MGRPRTPTSILDGRGSFLQKPSRSRPDEPTTDKPIGDAPTYLTKEERKVWRELVKQSLPGVLMESDRLMFALMVRLAAKFQSGAPMMAAETSQLISLSGKFAMNAADRSKVAIEKKKTNSMELAIAARKKTA
jgi:phage terminase small subunit